MSSQTDQSSTSGVELLANIDPARALGLAISHLMSKPVFAKQSFAACARCLTGQINRKHYLIAMGDNQVLGFLGWALVPRDKADLWLQGDELAYEDCWSGDVLVIFAWGSEVFDATRAMLERLREIGRDQTLVYFKRLYPDGRSRPGRLSVNAFVDAHIRAARMARQ